MLTKYFKRTQDNSALNRDIYKIIQIRFKIKYVHHFKMHFNSYLLTKGSKDNVIFNVIYNYVAIH